MIFLITIVSFTILCIVYKKKMLFIGGMSFFYLLSLMVNKEMFQVQNNSTTSSGSNSDPQPISMEEISPSPIEDKLTLNSEKEINEEVFYVLNSLLTKTYFKKNRENIERVIRDYEINDVFSLADKVLNVEKNNKYDNFLERITCLEKDKVNYTRCDNINYKKLYAFSELNKVYTFSIEFVVELINKHKIYRLCDVPENILKNKAQYGYEYNGYLFYLNRFSLSNKFYKLLELLELDKLLLNQNKTIPLQERLYNYVDKDHTVSKDLNSLIVLFDYYKILDDVRINNEEEDFDYDYSLLRNIDLNQNYWTNNYYFKKYRVKSKIIDSINRLTLDDKDIFRHELNEKYAKQDRSEIREEFKVMDLEGEETDKSNSEFLSTLNLASIKNNFVKTFIDIIEEILVICNEGCKIDGNQNYYLGTLNYYFANIIKVFIKDGRMFYVGIFVIFLSMMMYFIETSK